MSFTRWELSVLKGAYRSVRFVAQRRHLKFEMTFDRYLELVFLPCYICGAPPQNVARKKFSRYFDKPTLVEFRIQGIDRVDNTKGYVKGNIEPCCHRCNQVKSSLSLPDLEVMLAKIKKAVHARQRPGGEDPGLHGSGSGEG